MEFLNRVLGIRVIYPETAPGAMPNYIESRYRMQNVTLDGRPAVFVYPKTDLDAINAIKKHLAKIEETNGTPAVLVPEHLTYRQKEYLLRDRIPFIVEGKQIYLPFLAVYLQERSDSERRETTAMLPSAQLLLLYYIYHGCGELLASEATRNLGFTATSVSRASRQLEALGLIRTEKRGVQKVIFSEKAPKALFAEAKDRMCNPVKKTVYVSKAAIKENLPMSGYTALAEYTMINPPAVECFASDSISAWEKASSGGLQNADDQIELELWRYDPRKLSGGDCADRLSLALSLRDDRDERVEAAVEEMLEQVWREIDGTGN